MQVDGGTRFTSPMQCLVQTIRTEGFRAVYKGASAPLVGWGIIDSLLWGSMVQYRLLLESYNIKHYSSYVPLNQQHQHPSFNNNNLNHINTAHNNQLSTINPSS